MQDIPDKSIDMILCDLPYGITDCSWDSIIPAAELWKQYRRIIKNKGVIALFASQPFTTHLINSNKTDFRYCWYWKKNNVTGGIFAKVQPMRCIEDICIFVTDKGNEGRHMELRKYFFDELEKSGLKRKDINALLGNKMASHYFTYGQQFAIPNAESYKKLQTTGYFQKPYEEIVAMYESDGAADVQTYNPQGLEKLETPIINECHRNMQVYKNDVDTSIQWFTNYPTHFLEFDGLPTAGRLNPTQKPVELLEYLIKTYTNEGETVLDNCAGSGSTGIACMNTGRRFIGIEKDAEQFEIMENRIKNHEGVLKNG